MARGTCAKFSVLNYYTSQVKLQTLDSMKKYKIISTLLSKLIKIIGLIFNTHYKIKTNKFLIRPKDWNIKDQYQQLICTKIKDPKRSI